jgi:hypothetical protein
VGKVNAYAAVREVLGLSGMAAEDAGPRADVWPNPAGQQLVVQCPEAAGRWRLVDLTGRVVAEGAFAGGERLTVPVGAYARGSYVWEWQVAGRREVTHLAFI